MDKSMKDYSFKPKARIKKLVSENITLGTELEITTPHDDYSEIEGIVGDFDDVYLKYDCSIQDTGCEIVTHPYSWSYYNKFGWKEKLRTLSNIGCTSYENGHCGLHIHCNFDATTIANWAKIQMFVAICQNYLMDFGKKRSGNCNQYSLFENANNLAKFYKSSGLGKLRYNSSRYVALNFTDFGTAEFRFFRGTLKYSRFHASHLFVISMVLFASEISLTYLLFNVNNDVEVWRTYYKFLSKYNKLKPLREYLNKQKLYI